MKFKVEVEREDDGRWIAEVAELPGVLVYGDSIEQPKAQPLTLRVLADRLDNGEAMPFEASPSRLHEQLVEHARASPSGSVAAPRLD